MYFLNVMNIILLNQLCHLCALDFFSISDFVQKVAGVIFISRNFISGPES